MIRRQHRFHGYNSLRFAYRRGQTIHGNSCATKYVRNPRRDSYRVAVVVSRKVHKNAVVRNRIRRRIYEIIRQNLAASLNYDIIISVYSEQLADLPAKQLQLLILSQLGQAGLLKVTKNNNFS